MVSMVLKECESLTSPEWNTNSSYEDNINAPENKNEMAFKKRHLFTAKTLPHGRVVPPPPPTSGLQVRAVYSHDGEGETKMSFMEGDMINIIGEKASDGWQYGLNTKTGKYGTLLEIF